MGSEMKFYYETLLKTLFRILRKEKATCWVTLHHQRSIRRCKEQQKIEKNEGLRIGGGSAIHLQNTEWWRSSSEYLHTCAVIVIFLFSRIWLFAFVCVFTPYCNVCAWHALNKGNLFTYLLIYFWRRVKPQTYSYNLDAVPPIHVVSNHVDTDKLTTAHGGTFTSS